MVNAPQQNRTSSQSNAPVDEREEQRKRASRGLRTLAHDIAALKRNNQKQEPQKRAPNHQQSAPRMAPPPEPKTIPTPSANQAKPALQEQSTHYRAELEKLAQKYIPEKQKVSPTPPQSHSSKPTNEALKSFEMNKAFNDQLHKKPSPAPKIPEVKQKIEETPQPKSPQPVTPKPIPAQKVAVKPVQPPAPAPVRTEKVEVKEEVKKQPEEKKLTELTEQDINREMERILNAQKEKKEERKRLWEEQEKKESQKQDEPEKRERPQTSQKQLEETLSSLTQRIESSTSRITTYREEERVANASLKNLFERRDIINKNLDPIKERERAVLEAIKGLEEKEASASNKIEKRDAENRRWEKENERRELEDERWRLEEIFDKLRLVIEKTEYELVSIQKKRNEEESHKKELDEEKTHAQTHKSLLSKREERDLVERKGGDIQDEITNLKNELKVIRSGEESLEKDKKDLEGKIGALNDVGMKHSLEKERRGIEDKLREIEERRWAREDDLKKHYAEKDERDRELKMLDSELESLELKLGEFENRERSSPERAL